MPMTREAIESVRGIVLPDGITAAGRYTAFSRAMRVTWRSDLEGKLHQVYVNGQFAGVTLNCEQRQLVVQLPSSFEAAVRLEVVGVDRNEAHVDFAEELDSAAIDHTRVRLAILRSQTLPLDAVANVYGDNGTGQIDYAVPLNPAPIPLWPCRQDKAGFGMAQFATGDFGYESAAAVGFGQGHFGQGQFGLDADTLEWISPELTLGAYRFGVTITDAQGHESLASETMPIAVVPPARPAAGLGLASFDNSGQITLSISEQP